MAYTESDLESIEQAIASGSRRVTSGEKTIEYASMAELLRAYDLIRRALGRAPAAAPSRVYPRFSKGL